MRKWTSLAGPARRSRSSSTPRPCATRPAASSRRWPPSTIVTDRKRVEAERERALLREREARSAAEQANRLKDDFLATISHELRTPLNAILGWADMLRAGMLDESRRARALESIYANARRQAQLIDDLLDVSRIITGTVRLQVAPLDLSDVVHAAVDVITPAAAARHIALRIEGGPGVPLRGDAARLQQIVWNLLSNAVKFTPEGGAVTVRLERTPTAVVLTVRDNGMGIPPEFLPYVFDRFRQADSGTTRAFGGLGLGLAIVRHLAELHGGTVTAESDGQGHGATFAVTLPALDIRVPVQTPRLVTASAEPPRDGVDLQGVRVLLVEDERDTRELLSVALAGYGARVRAAASVNEALDALRAAVPDVLVSDIGMPGRDGYDLLDAVRSADEPRISTVPAIALTAYAKPEDRAPGALLWVPGAPHEAARARAARACHSCARAGPDAGASRRVMRSLCVFCGSSPGAGPSYQLAATHARSHPGRPTHPSRVRRGARGTHARGR